MNTNNFSYFCREPPKIMYMKKTVLLTLALTITFYSSCPNTTIKIKKTPLNTVDVLIEAISTVESRGIVSIVNEKESAYGHLQVRKLVIKDVNKYFNTNYTITDALDSLKSIDIFIKYQSIYNPEFEFEKAARIWNGGPRGMDKISTRKYWDKVLYYYEKIANSKTKFEVVKD